MRTRWSITNNKRATGVQRRYRQGKEREDEDGSEDAVDIASCYSSSPVLCTLRLIWRILRTIKTIFSLIFFGLTKRSVLLHKNYLFGETISSLTGSGVTARAWALVRWCVWRVRWWSHLHTLISRLMSLGAGRLAVRLAPLLVGLTQTKALLRFFSPRLSFSVEQDIPPAGENGEDQF